MCDGNYLNSATLPPIYDNVGKLVEDEPPCTVKILRPPLRVLRDLIESMFHFE
jgi:hypothetical protein